MTEDLDNEAESRVEVLLAFQTGLLSSIIPPVRAISVGWSKRARALAMRVFTERELSEEERETLSCVSSEAAAILSWAAHRIEDEFIVSDKPIGELEAIGPWVYHRYELA